MRGKAIQTETGTREEGDASHTERKEEGIVKCWNDGMMG